MHNPDAANVDAFVDFSQLLGLVETAGAGAARSILDAYWRSAETLGAALVEAAQAGDFDAARRVAHALRGASANVGARAVAEAAAAAEAACRAGDLSGLAAAPRSIEASVASTRRILDADPRLAA